MACSPEPTQCKNADLGIGSFGSLLSGSARQLSIPLVELVPERYQLCMLFRQLLTAHLQSQKVQNAHTVDEHVWQIRLVL